MPNKAINQAAIDDFVAKQQLVTGPKDGLLEAVSLAVLPEFQSMGFGLQLLEFLKAMISKLGVDLVADASKRGFPIYVKFGFKHIGDIKLTSKTIQADDLSLVHLPQLTVPVVCLSHTYKAAF